MKTSRFLALMLLVATSLWFVWGYFQKGSHQESINNNLSKGTEQAQSQMPLFKVSVLPIALSTHARSIILSGRTEADRRANAMTRANGTVVRLNIKRGSVVKEGDVIAELSDEARESSVKKAQARLEQRQGELKARLKLIAQGNFPAINKTQLEAELKEAEASLAQAKVEFDRSKVLSPFNGVVNDVPVEVGQSLQVGQSVAEIIAPDPMLAIAEIAERQLSGVKIGTKAVVRLVTGQTFESNVRFISTKANAQTRTYRLEVGIKNPQGVISDGITSEILVELAPVPASKIPRSSLTFSSQGKLGVRVVDAENTVQFVAVSPVDDGAETLWVTGLQNAQRLIVQGQDFVKEGAKVEPVAAMIAGN
jgi:membrane fusion protein, multidrug efflux system